MIVEPKLGTVLPNGAVVIAASSRNAYEWTILAFNERRIEYVTWKASRPGDLRDTVHGHYFTRLDDAAIDFYSR